MISVLYVDDEEGLLDIGKLFLEKSGQFRVDTVTSADEALRILKTASYDAIVSDYQMPNKDGIALLKAIRTEFPDLPFIIFTGKGREEVVIEAFEIGADFYLQKGGQPRPQFLELGHKITAAVRRRKAEKELQESEIRYRNVVEDQTEFISRFLPDGTYIFVNEAFCRYFNKKKKDILGKKFKPDIPKEDRSLIKEHFYSLTKEHPISIIEHRIVLPEGEIRWQQWSDRAIFNDNATLIEYQSVGRDITDRKHAEQALSLAQEKYSKAFFLAPDAITVSDLESGRFTEVNDTATKIFGYSREEMIGKSAVELGIWLKNDDRETFIEMLRTRGKIEQYEMIERRKSGELINVSVSADTIILGSTRYLIAVIRDITERKQAGQALRESETRYSSLFDNNHSVSLLTDPDTGLIVDVNEAAARYYGYSREQLTRMGISDLNRVDKKTVIRNLTRRKGQGASHFLSTHYLASGEQRSVEVYSGPILIHGKPLFYSIIHDVTDKRKAEEDLQKSHQILEGVMNTIPVSVFWKDKNLIYLGCNTPFARDAGFEKPEDIIGKDDYAMGWHEQAELYRADDRLVIDSGKIKVLIEEPQTTPSGDHICLLTSKVPLKNAEGEIIGVLGSYLDITDRKLMEEEVRSLNRVLEQRVAERTEQLNASLEDKVLLLREIHHRVKNNLQIIASLLNLQSRYVTDKKVLETLRDSQSRVRAMALVHERIYQSPEIGTINLAEYLRYLINQLFAFYNIPKFQVEVSVVIDDIPADIDTAIPLGLIINELVSNALKHAFPEGRKGKISVRGTQVSQDQLKFVFQDNGIGMSADRNWEKSNSLGLRLVRDLTKQLDGTVEMEQDGGTIYTITVKPKHPY